MRPKEDTITIQECMCGDRLRFRGGIEKQMVRRIPKLILLSPVLGDRLSCHKSEREVESYESISAEGRFEYSNNNNYI